MINLYPLRRSLSLAPLLGLLLPIQPLQTSAMGLHESGDRPLPLTTVQRQLQAQANQSVWQKRPRRPLTIRSGILCAISPGLIGKLDSWSDRPLFLWQGEGSQIRVRDYHQRDQILWEASVSKAQASLRYEGPVMLQPGQQYQWQIVSSVNPVASNARTLNRPTKQGTWETFRILPSEQRQAIATELRTLEQTLQQQNASVEDIALSKANFFVDRDLWSDALQVLYEVQNPSAQFVEQRSTYVAGLCKSPTP
jgi:hypothetical protein